MMYDREQITLKTSDMDRKISQKACKELWHDASGQGISEQEKHIHKSTYHRKKSHAI